MTKMGLAPSVTLSSNRDSRLQCRRLYLVPNYVLDAVGGSSERPAEMGNTSSSGRSHQEETVDFGYLAPQGVYTGARDWNHSIVTQLIVDRKLAPFYRPLEDYEESWDDEQILAHMKEPQSQEGGEGEGNGTRADAASIVSSSSRTHHKRPSASAKDSSREQSKHPELGIYRGATDCPICFLVRPIQSLLFVANPFIITPHSIILQTSTTLGAVIKLFAPNALSRSSALTPQPPILSRSPHRAPTAFKKTLELSTLLLHGELE